MPQQWTCVEEWRGIDLLALNAWSSARRIARVGYEVKVSRSDLRSELLRPEKRAVNVAWCSLFYFAVPEGLLTADELSYREPDGGFEPQDFVGTRCPMACSPRRGRKTYLKRVPIPIVGRQYMGDWQWIKCPTCNGKGYVGKSRVLEEAPTLWVPPDVGLVVVRETSWGISSEVVRRAPGRDVEAMTNYEANRLVRWTSIRPDPRHERRA